MADEKKTEKTQEDFVKAYNELSEEYGYIILPQMTLTVQKKEEEKTA